MLSYENLISKGFCLNEYKGEGKFYELVETNEQKIENILKVAGIDYDPECMDNKVILQLKEDFSNKLICVGCDVWDLSDYDFEKILEVM